MASGGLVSDVSDMLDESDSEIAVDLDENFAISTDNRFEQMAALVIGSKQYQEKGKRVAVAVWMDLQV